VSISATPVFEVTRNSPYILALTADYTGNSYPTYPAESTTLAAGALVPSKSAGPVPTRAKIVFYGTGSDDSTYLARIIGLQVGPGGYYVPVTLWEGTITLSTFVGTSGLVSGPGAIADIITTGTAGNNGVDCEAVNPSDNTPAHLVLDCKGSFGLLLQFNMNSSAISGNALVGWL
jgi:hypothetical protein